MAAQRSEAEQLVRSMIDAWNRRDLDAMIANADPEIEYVNAPDAMEPGTRHGHAGLALVVAKQWEALEPDGRQDLERVQERGDEILTVVRLSRSMPGSESRIETRGLLAWRIADRRVTRMQVLGAGPSFAEAADSAGLS
jgi:ketosteroid isomerase-like protein